MAPWTAGSTPRKPKPSPCVTDRSKAASRSGRTHFGVCGPPALMEGPVRPERTPLTDNTSTGKTVRSITAVQDRNPAEADTSSSVAQVMNKRIKREALLRAADRRQLPPEPLSPSATSGLGRHADTPSAAPDSAIARVISAAEYDRSHAHVDRVAAANDRADAFVDRHEALADRMAAARDRRHAFLDGLTGSYNRESGFAGAEPGPGRALHAAASQWSSRSWMSMA